MGIADELRHNSTPFNKVVIWGLRKKWHTHRFIFQAYFENLKKCGIPVIWVEDEKKNQQLIESNDIVFSTGDVYGKMVPRKKSLEDYNLPIRNDIFYCLHAENDFFLNKLDRKKYLLLKFYNNEAEQFHKEYEAVHFDSETKTLYQPWGTDLLPHEFKTPIFSKTKNVFWIGSIWKGRHNEGNLSNIQRMVPIIKNKGLRFFSVRFVPNMVNRLLIRKSRITPAIGGEIQVETNYLPCRMFKNISYGQLGFSNIEKFNDLLVDCNVYDPDMEKMFSAVLALTEERYLEIVRKQQEVVKRYTIAHHLNNVFTHIVKN